MTNKMIILLESVELMKQGILKPTGQKIVVELADGKKELDVPETIHTYQTWKKLGFQVKKGSKAVAKFAIWKHTTKQLDEVDDDGNPKEKSNMFMKQSNFFTQAQVEPIST
jgi:hypothetical protein